MSFPSWRSSGSRRKACTRRSVCSFCCLYPVSNGTERPRSSKAVGSTRLSPCSATYSAEPRHIRHGEYGATTNGRDARVRRARRYVSNRLASMRDCGCCRGVRRSSTRRAVAALAVCEDVLWVEEGHMFAWRMNLRGKNGTCTFYVRRAGHHRYRGRVSRAHADAQTGRSIAETHRACPTVRAVFGEDEGARWRWAGECISGRVCRRQREAPTAACAGACGPVGRDVGYASIGLVDITGGSRGPPDGE